MARSEDIAWAAGLFEGEGTSCIGADQRQPMAALVMTDEDVVRRFAAIVGVGSVRHYETKGKPVWRWFTGSRDGVLSVLNLLWPYLGERRQQRASEVIERAAKIIPRAGERSHCKRGHDFSDPRHLYIHRKTGKRHCRTCRMDAKRRRQVIHGSAN